MWQDCSLTAVQRKTAFLEQSCWPEFDMFGSMQEGFPTEVGLCRHQCFSVVAPATQDSPKASPRKNFIEQLYKAIAEMNADWKVEKAQYAEFNVPTCANIAVCQLCRERQPFWNSHDGLNLICLDQCHGVGSHGKLLPRLTPKSCYKVYSLTLIHDTSFSPKVIVAGLPRKALPWK